VSKIIMRVLAGLRLAFNSALLAACLCRPACASSAAYLVLFLVSSGARLAPPPLTTQLLALALSAAAAALTLGGWSFPLYASVDGISAWLPDLILAALALLCVCANAAVRLRHWRAGLSTALVGRARDMLAVQLEEEEEGQARRREAGGSGLPPFGLTISYEEGAAAVGGGAECRMEAGTAARGAEPPSGADPSSAMNAPGGKWAALRPAVLALALGLGSAAAAMRPSALTAPLYICGLAALVITGVSDTGVSDTGVSDTEVPDTGVLAGGNAGAAPGAASGAPAAGGAARASTLRGATQVGLLLLLQAYLGCLLLGVYAAQLWYSSNNVILYTSNDIIVLLLYYIGCLLLAIYTAQLRHAVVVVPVVVVVE
jgi:hypothetical protein